MFRKPKMKSSKNNDLAIVIKRKNFTKSYAEQNFLSKICKYADTGKSYWKKFNTNKIITQNILESIIFFNHSDLSSN